MIGQTFHPNLIQTSNLSPFLIQIPSVRTSFTGVGPVESDSVQHLEGFPMLGLRRCCCHLGILNTFWTKDLHFHFALGSAKYIGNLVNISDIPNILHPIPRSQPPYHSSYSSHPPLCSFDQSLISSLLNAPITPSFSTWPLPNPIPMPHRLSETSTVFQPHSLLVPHSLPNPHSP